jgi:hypothetical protein
LAKIEVTLVPTDQITSHRSGGDMGAPREPAEQEQALFRVLWQRVQNAADKPHLLDRSQTALRLILNRPEDQIILADKASRIAAIVEALPDDVTSAKGKTALAMAADACCQILDRAEQYRLAGTPAVQGLAQETAKHHVMPADTIAALDHHGGPWPHQRQSRSAAKKFPAGTITMLLALAMVLALGWAIAVKDRPDDKSRSEPPVRPLVTQMQGAAHGSIPPTNLFGGELRVATENGRTFVTVTGIPAGECVLAGWDLVHRGILTINGVTPNRVSAALLNELCHQEDPATLKWTPKPGS